jgi:hypothetical protein
MAARARLDQAQRDREGIELDLELGLGRNLQERRAALDAVRAAERQVVAAERVFNAALEDLRPEVAAEIGESAARALEQFVIADAALGFWNNRLRELLPSVQGEAAELLAQGQAARWEQELSAAQKLARIRGEREAFRAAPNIYRTRKYLEALSEGLANARKFFLAFDPGDRDVTIRIIAEEKARADDTNFPSRGR